jgi:hypothetical protein
VNLAVKPQCEEDDGRGLAAGPQLEHQNVTTEGNLWDGNDDECTAEARGPARRMRPGQRTDVSTVWRGRRRVVVPDLRKRDVLSTFCHRRGQLYDLASWRGFPPQAQTRHAFDCGPRFLLRIARDERAGYARMRSDANSHRARPVSHSPAKTCR